MKRMLKPLILFYLCVAIIIAALAQQETNKPFAELILLKQKSDKDTSKVNLLLRLSEYYFLKLPKVSTDLDSSLAYAFSAEALSNTLAYQRGLGNSYRQQGKIHKAKNDITKGKYFVNKAIEIFKANNYLPELGETYFDFSGYYSLHGNEMIEKIRIIEHLSLPAFKQAGNLKKIADVLKELGDLQQLKGDY